MNIIMLGPQGCGKGTHSKILAEKTGLDHVSSGDLLREEVKKETELGLKIKEMMEEGKLVPDDVVISLIEDKVANAPKGVILDGFPRNLLQAMELDKIIKIDKTIHMDLSDEEAVKRLAARRQCKNNCKIYSTLYKQPKIAGICDDCGEEIFQRDDDKPEAIKRRLELYHKETRPLIDFYKNSGILRQVKSKEDMDETADLIEEAFKA